MIAEHHPDRVVPTFPVHNATIAVCPRLHWSTYCHKRIGTFPAGAVRVSPGVHNTDEELAMLLDALKQVAGG